MRKPSRPGVVTVANACHSRSGLRLMPTAEATAGARRPGKVTIAAWPDGRSTVIGTRRSRSHGETMQKVTSASTHTCHVVAIARRAGSSRSSARCSVKTQNSAIALHPPKRWVSSNALWTRRRTTGRAPATMIRQSTAIALATTRVVAVAGPVSAVAVNAHSHAVPASAQPACSPPTWLTFDTLQRSHNGHSCDPRPARPKRTLRTCCRRISTAPVRLASVSAARSERPPAPAIRMPALTSRTRAKEPEGCGGSVAGRITEHDGAAQRIIPDSGASGRVARRLLHRHADDQPHGAGRVRVGIAAVVLPRQADVERAPDVLLDRRPAAQLDVVVRVLGVHDRHAEARVALQVAVLAAPGHRGEEDLLAVAPGPHRGRLRSAVRVEGGEDGEVGAVEQPADLVVEGEGHGPEPTARDRSRRAYWDFATGFGALPGRCRVTVSPPAAASAGAGSVCSRPWKAEATRCACALASSARLPANSSSTVAFHRCSHCTKCPRRNPTCVCSRACGAKAPPPYERSPRRIVSQNDVIRGTCASRSSFATSVKMKPMIGSSSARP